MLTFLPSVVILGSALMASVLLSRNQVLPAADTMASQQLRNAMLLATIVQSGHFAEEAITGFHVEFPALFSLPAMPFIMFLSFNLAWIGLWFAAIPAIEKLRSIALIPAWFLAIAGTLNGIAHPAMALLAAGYFPGLYSSPVVGVTCMWLCVCLLRATR